MTHPVSPSTIRNREPILDILKKYIIGAKKILEIGSGGGEHAVYFSDYFSQATWTTSDQFENHSLIKYRILESKLKNIKGPCQLKVGVDDFPKGVFDYVFTANTLHIMSWKECKALFKLLGKRLREGSVVFFYGPFNYANEFTSESNRQFDNWLKQRQSHSGIRNFEEVQASMNKFGFKLLEDHQMPANNRLLVFERLEFTKGHQ